MRLSIPKKCYNINIIYIIYKLILEGGEGNASKSWFYGGINFRHYGILEFTALGAGVALSVRLSIGLSSLLLRVL